MRRGRLISVGVVVGLGVCGPAVAAGGAVGGGATAGGAVAAPRLRHVAAAPPVSVAETAAGVYEFDYAHPSLGTMHVVTSGSATGEEGPVPSSIVITDADGTVVYRATTEVYWLKPLSVFAPALRTADIAGNLFFGYNPGRYDGVVVLVPTPAGFDDLGSFWTDGEGGRFYMAEVADPNGDGLQEIAASSHDCYPSCADGTVGTETNVWNGIDDFVQAGPWRGGPCAFTAFGVPTPAQLVGSQEVKFRRGSYGSTITGRLAAGTFTRYLLGAAENQIMTVRLRSSNGAALASVDAPDGPSNPTRSTPLMPGVTDYETQLFSTGDWIIDVYACGADTEYTLDVTIR